MKLNNKGFAISTILYGLLMMTSLIFFLLIATMSNGKTTNDKLIDTIETELNNCVTNKTC